MQRRSRNKHVRLVEFIFRNEIEIWEAVEKERSIGTGKMGGASSGHVHISDPTANEAIRNVGELRCVFIRNGVKIDWPERWLRIIDAVRDWCEPNVLKREILRRRYSGESWVKTCADIKVSPDKHLSESKYHRVVGQICTFAVQCAVQMQVIKIF